MWEQGLLPYAQGGRQEDSGSSSAGAAERSSPSAGSAQGKGLVREAKPADT